MPTSDDATSLARRRRTQSRPDRRGRPGGIRGDGLAVPLETVAENAGVGIATLYRRFPTRDDLVAACFERRLADYARAAEDALAAPDAWPGFVTTSSGSARCRPRTVA